MSEITLLDWAGIVFYLAICARYVYLQWWIGGVEVDIMNRVRGRMIASCSPY